MNIQDQIKETIEYSVWKSVGNSIRDSVYISVRHSIDYSVWKSVGNSVGDHIRDSINAIIKEYEYPKL